jgi:hypothetical protein
LTLRPWSNASRNWSGQEPTSIRADCGRWQTSRIFAGGPNGRPGAPAVHDNLERALTAGSTDPAFLRGVEAIAEQLRRIVTSLGAVPIPSVGALFDPRLHEAVGTVPAIDHPPDTVVTEVRQGFLLDGEVLRPAQVVVAQSTPEDGQREAHLSHGVRRGTREG